MTRRWFVRLAAATAAMAVLPFVPVSVRAQSQDWQVIQRGLYLTRAGDCAACHSLPDQPPYAGGYPLETPFGTIHSANITPDPDTGIGRWTSDDFYRALDKGRGRGGRRLYPAFPYTHLTLVTREDSDAIFAYLNTLEPVRHRVAAPDLIWPLGWRFLLAGWNLLNFEQRTFTPDPNQSPAHNRGRYLVEGLAHCGMCHSPKTFLGAEEDGDAAFTGGMAEGWWAPSLRRGGQGGIGDWSTDQIVHFLRDGRNDRSIAFGPMAQVIRDSTRHLNEGDLRAIATYIQALPAAEEGSSRTVHDLPEEQHRVGQLVYETQCAACHGPGGKGVANMVPSLEESSFAQASNPRSVIRLILEGGVAATTAAFPTAQSMPGFAWKLNDAEVAAVTNFIRNSFGNHAPLIASGDVAPIRRAR